jgi:uncharacterized protein (TIGR03086 family)
MSEVRDRYQRVGAGFGRRLAGIGAAQWALPTPCSAWDVRSLVTHVIATHGRVTSLLSGVAPAEVDADGDLTGQWEGATAAVLDALDDPLQAATLIGGMFGEQPFESLVGRLLCADTVFHTWDLSRATGQDEELDSTSVAAAMTLLQPLDEAIRGPGGFAVKIVPPVGADDQTRFLNFGGRSCA